MNRMSVPVLLFGLAAVPSPGLAQGRAPDLSQVSIEDLMNIEITSASRKEQRAADVAAAVFVITHDDIRRSGMTTIPDLLRLAPGVDVAQINSNKWAVSVRGFNGLYANKLLVLVDGRSVYNRIFSGVFWDTEDLMLDDIDRIEVIRGPGAAMWGANAVNGVINIVTKAAGRHAGRTRPRRRRARRRTGSRPLRRDARRGELPRVFAVDRPGSIAHRAGHARQRRVPQPHDGIPRRLDQRSRRVHAGRRLHGGPGARAVAQPRPADGRRANRSRTIPPTPRAAISSAAGRTRAPAARRCRSSRSSTSRAGRSRSAIYDRHVVRRRHAIPHGARCAPGSGRRRRLPVHRRAIRRARRLFADPAGRRLVPRDRLRPGRDRALREPPGGHARQPGAVRLRRRRGRAADRARDVEGASPPAPLGGHVSRPADAVALRAGDSRGLPAGSEPPAGCRWSSPLLGNPAAETETLVDAEAGYRLEIGTAASIDVTGFVGRYDHLRTQEPAAPVVQFVPSPQILVDVAVRQPARGDDARPRGRGPLGAGPGLAPRRQLHGLPRHAAARGRRVRIPPPRSDGRERAARAVAAAVVVFADRPRDAQRRALPRRSARAAPGGRLHASRRQRGVAVHQPSVRRWRSARTSSTRRTPSSPAPARCCSSTQVPRSASLRLRWTF